MGLRGPRPLDVKHLEGEAVQWACFFYTLRDGQPGHMQRVEWSPQQTIGAFIAKGLLGGNPSQGMRKQRASLGKPVGPAIFIPVSEAARMLPEKMKTKGWFISRPVMPKREIWQQLKTARTVDQVRKAARGIGNLRVAFTSSLEKWAQNPDRALCHYAKGVLTAKRLPHYPKTDRPTSDDKRVLFLAKVMAGLTMEIAPITAVKRLSHWQWPKDWAEKPLKEYVERSIGEKP